MKVHKITREFSSDFIILRFGTKNNSVNQRLSFKKVVIKTYKRYNSFSKHKKKKSSN